jgi:NAD(P)-dependent dehydrogenase (short-subunit alcohol dehydrogenase family)
MDSSPNHVAVITGAARGRDEAKPCGGARPPEKVFTDIVDTNLRVVWNAIAATAPSMIRRGNGGSMVLVSSMQGLVGRGGDESAATFAYAASKHGVAD